MDFFKHMIPNTTPHFIKPGWSQRVTQVKGFSHSFLLPPSLSPNRQARGSTPGGGDRIYKVEEK